MAYLLSKDQAESLTMHNEDKKNQTTSENNTFQPLVLATFLNLCNCIVLLSTWIRDIAAEWNPTNPFALPLCVFSLKHQNIDTYVIYKTKNVNT